MVNKNTGLQPKMDVMSEDTIESLENELSLVDGQIASLQERRAQLLRQKNNLIQAQENFRRAQLQNFNWESQDFAWSKKLTSTLQDIFDINFYRPHQLSCMNALLSKHDVMLIMPTGGGKSLCFQLPALMASGLTLVVSPLVALMEDQVMALKRKKINAEMLCADTPRAEVTRILNSMIDPASEMKLLYVTPEKLAKSKRFMAKLQNAYKRGLFSHLAIDEVHCCSQWGHDFRPDYKFLGVMKSLFPKVPILGLTATATSTVTEDTQKILNLKDCLVFKAAFNRANLFYEVRAKPSNTEDCIRELVQMLSEEFRNQSGIIYTLTIKDVETLAKDLKTQGIKAAPYHASLEAKQRSQTHRKWLSAEIQVVVATIAFGMGIDKPNVRFVIHHSISKSMENFYQESGRAGRDDQPAKCIAYYKFSDIFRISTMVFTEQTGLEKLYGIVAYCNNLDRCRRSIIADHFGEVWERADCNGMCDICQNQDNQTDLEDVGVYVEAVVQILDQAATTDSKMTALKLVNALLGRGEGKFKVLGWKPKDLSTDKAERIISKMLLEGYLKEDFAFTPYSTISYIILGRRTIQGRSHQWRFPKAASPLPKVKRQSTKAVAGKCPSKKAKTSKTVVCLSSDEDIDLN
ncbi:hypothetical protein TCAL_09653 [Tigriopus californicus]|uniref:ATP-dependent DNA helicase n=1 Tax=Tigriopus californicus TaxID=6832 RepID=A0A553NSU0_TIGCA|nr:ATP-dependent DNA helicase Q1-like [Tigriopus californicus]TRY68473.1 hypothetical protein TCAL_09653 [Tigriopus californicus]|eukprot:TCALIF_09653-PA protein Name:"Similar to Recql ATP-dependent DNA helicase Q1 (Rattus norvegicus)" AED:0.04 eAED:0.04 QI:70/1/1/1/1/1/4/209/632